MSGSRNAAVASMALGQALGVRRRQVALKRRRLHGAERQRCQQQRPAAERFAICAERRAAGLAHQLDDRRDIGMIDGQAHFGGGEAAFHGVRRELRRRACCRLVLGAVFFFAAMRRPRWFSLPRMMRAPRA